MRGNLVWAAVVSAVILAVGELLVLGMGEAPAVSAVPPVLAVATFFVLRRLKHGVVPSTTRHQYTLFAPRAGDEKVADLVARLEARGYQLELATLDDAGVAGRPPAAGAPLAGPQLRLRDRRAAAELGEVAVRVRRGVDGGLAGLVEADDTGPGFYDELAQFLIAELPSLLPDVEFMAMGKAPVRRPAAVLEGELPQKPLGLGLL